MIDTKICPICRNKMKSNDFGFIQRFCTGKNHFVQLISNKKTKNVDYIRLSLTYDYDKIVAIDYFNNKSIIYLFHDGAKKNEIEIPYVLDADFPNLVALKEKVNLFITYS